MNNNRMECMDVNSIVFMGIGANKTKATKLTFLITILRRIRSFLLPLFCVLAVFLSGVTFVHAEEYYWYVMHWGGAYPTFSTPKEACDASLDDYASFACPDNETNCRPSVLKEGRSMTLVYPSNNSPYPYYLCGGIVNYTSFDPDSPLPDKFFKGLTATGRGGDGCPPDQSVNPTTGICGNDLQKGSPRCEAGNPINIPIGNKFQAETDYVATGVNALSITRVYNSLDGLWRHSYSTSLRILPHSVAVIFADGRETFFSLDGGTITPFGSESGRLIQENSKWVYQSQNNQEMIFSEEGKLLSVLSPKGMIQLSYDINRVLITNQLGATLEVILRGDGQPLSVQVAGEEISYAYESNNLVGVAYPNGTSKTYHYEDSRFPNALTGITDENGNRYATWNYDDEGRAISSEHANGVDKTTLTYNADGTTTVTNPLGKQTTYHFTTIHGVKKVTQVEGHPTTSCEGANRSYSYDANGNIASKTDWNGVVTNYTYDMDRNLELTRVEAVGTPQERTITTEWYPDFRLPTRITEPGKITEYGYDANGRKLSHKVLSTQ